VIFLQIKENSPTSSFKSNDIKSGRKIEFLQKFLFLFLFLQIKRDKSVVISIHKDKPHLRTLDREGLRAWGTKRKRY
jgi:hypothetical protein